MFGRFWGLLELAGLCLLMPAIVLHELTHWIAARGVSERLRFHIDPVQPAISVDWKEEAPEWRLRVAKVAPTIVGLVLGPIVLFWLVKDANGLVSSLVVVILWGVYSWPSAGDRQPPKLAKTT